MKKLAGSFRYSQWDPWLIISQIICIQCVLYTTLGLLLFVLGSLKSETSSLDHIFEYHEVQVRDFGGKMVIVAFVLNALIGAVILWLIVERTKQCLDFSCTWYFFHLIVCWFYNGSFPTTFSWWTLNVACVSVMCVCGEFLCLKSELQAIPLSLGPKADL